MTSPNPQPMIVETHFKPFDLALSPSTTASSNDNSPSSATLANLETRIKSFALPSRSGNYTYAIQYIREYDILVIGDQKGHLFITKLNNGDIEVISQTYVGRDIASLTYIEALKILVIGCKHFMMYLTVPDCKKIYFTRHDQVYVEDYLHLDPVLSVIGNVNLYVTAYNLVRRKAIFRLSSQYKYTVKKLLPKRNLMVFGTVEGVILIYHSISRMLLTELKVVYAQGLASYLNILTPDVNEEHLLIGGCDGNVRKWCIKDDAHLEQVGHECTTNGSWLSGILLFDDSDTFLTLQLDEWVCFNSYSKMKQTSKVKIPNPKVEGRAFEKAKGNAIIYIKEKNLIVGGDYQNDRGTVFTIPVGEI